MRLTLLGVVIGLAGAFTLTRYLSSLLYSVKVTDPATFLVVSLALSGSGPGRLLVARTARGQS